MSKNQEWKDSGSTLSFKEWLREGLNNSVHEAVKNVSSSGYSNIDGSGSDAANTYKPTITHNTVLGINKYLVYGTATVIVVGIGYAIWHNKNKN